MYNFELFIVKNSIIKNKKNTKENQFKLKTAYKHKFNAKINAKSLSAKFQIYFTLFSSVDT